RRGRAVRQRRLRQRAERRRSRRCAPGVLRQVRAAHRAQGHLRPRQHLPSQPQHPAVRLTRRNSMGKIVNPTYISLDGVVESAHLWPSLPAGRGDTGDQIQVDLLQDSDAVVMGRRTYDGFAPVWPTRSGDPYSDRINTMPKYVVSSSLKDPEWANTTV